MAKYTQSLAVLLNDGSKQILPVSKANLIELVENTYTNHFGNIANPDVDTALAYLAGTYIPNATQEAKDYALGLVQALDGNSTISLTSGQAVTSISQTDGLVTASTGNINSQYVEVTNGTTNYGENGGTVQGALSYLAEYIGGVNNDNTITVVRSSDNSYAAVYTISQGGIPIGDTINIPKDMVATNGTLVYSRPRTTADGEGSGDITGTYISMTIANGDPFYIDVKDLIEYNDVTSNTEVSLTNTNHVIEATIGTIAASKISYNASDVNTELGTINSKINTLNGGVNTTGSVAKAVNDAVTGLNSDAATAKTENGFTYVITGVQEANGLLASTTYAALSDENIKTTMASGDALYTLANRSQQDPKDISNVKAALNTLAGEISAAQGNAVTGISYTQSNTYVNVGDGTAVENNTLTITIDDSNLGNVSKLQYDELDVTNVEAFGMYDLKS